MMMMSSVTIAGGPEGRGSVMVAETLALLEGGVVAEMLAMVGAGHAEEKWISMGCGVMP